MRGAGGAAPLAEMQPHSEGATEDAAHHVARVKAFLHAMPHPRGLGPASDVRQPHRTAARAPRLDWRRVVLEADNAHRRLLLAVI